MPSLTELAQRLKLTLVAITDAQRGGDPLAMAARLPAGSWVIFRHYDAPDRSILAIKLAALCRKRRLKLFVAGDPILARSVKAGLHLPDWLAGHPTPAIRRWKGLTVAAHDRLGLIRAAKLGAEAALLSPVFPTHSHPGAKPLRILAFRRLARGAKLPVIALGGIDRTSVSLLKKTPIAGIAAVGALSSPLL
jgi:thiamine-phosphate pyrophosphorylase